MDNLENKLENCKKNSVLNPNSDYKFTFKKTAKAPINIALIKYWGKSDETEILPLNDNLSLNLDTSIMYTQTEVTFCFFENPFLTKNINEEYMNKQNENDNCELLTENNALFDLKLFINENVYKLNKRQIDFYNFICLKYFKEYCSKIKLNIIINSINTIPTSAGCASSSSGGSALVLATYGLLIDIFKFFDSKYNLEDVQKWNIANYARKLSGSASRSIPNGIVLWNKKGEVESIYDMNYWKELRILLVLNNVNEKEYSSSDGMLLTKNTSSLFQYRVSTVVDEHMKKIMEYFVNKDFEGIATITMKDSNSFHSVCLDTFPPLMYLNESSFFIIKLINHFNGIVSNNKYMKSNDNLDKKIKCGYTFDAGPNCCIITLSEYESKIKKIIEIIYNKENIVDEEEIEKYKEFNIDMFTIKKFREEVMSKGFKIEKIVSFCVGEGAKLL